MELEAARSYEEDGVTLRLPHGLLLSALLVVVLGSTVFPFSGVGKDKEEAGNRVTILYDAFGKSPAVTKAWGFSALVEYGGKRILFDTGGNAEVFEHNVHALGADPGKLDFVVVSPPHRDHLSHL